MLMFIPFIFSLLFSVILRWILAVFTSAADKDGPVKGM